MKKSNMYMDLLANTVVQNANTYEDFDLLEAENNIASNSVIQKSDSVINLLNAKNISVKDTRLKKPQNHHGWYLMIRVAVVILVFFSVSLISLTAVTGFNSEFLKMLIDPDKGKVVISNDSKSEFSFYNFSYIPEGFAITDQLDLDNCFIETYKTKNEDTTIIISQYKDFDISIDYDNNNEIFFVNGIECKLLKNDSNYIMVCKIKDVICTIEVTGNTGIVDSIQDELSKIVESVEK